MEQEKWKVKSPRPDILECEVKWTLGSTTTSKASGHDRISAEVFQILKDDAVKVMHSICQQIWKTQQLEFWKYWKVLEYWKTSVFIPTPKKGNAKEWSNYPTIIWLISHASKVMLKILQAKFQQYMNQELPDLQAGFRKSRGQIATFVGSQKKQKNSRKTSTSASLITLKPSTVWITTNCEKSFKRWEYQTTLPAS